MRSRAVSVTPCLLEASTEIKRGFPGGLSKYTKRVSRVEIEQWNEYIETSL